MLSPSSACFTMATGSGDSPTKIISITNSSGPARQSEPQQSYTAGQPTGWLTAKLSGSAAPATLTLQATASLTLLAGTYTVTVAIKNKGATNTPQNIAVKFTIRGVAPSIAVASAATFTAPAAEAR